MKIVQNRKEWRYNTVMQLIEVRKLMVVEAVAEAKELEKYVFQDDFIVEGINAEQRNAFKIFIESITKIQSNTRDGLNGVRNGRS